jgi:gluconate kinase
MRPEMLPSQFEALEEPTDAIIVDISRSVPSIVDQLKSQLFND